MMETLLRPPPETAPDLEALIEEARRRARRRRAGFAAVALAALGVAAGAWWAWGGGTSSSRAAGGQARPVAPPIKIVGTQRIPLGESVLFAARGSTLFEVTLPSRPHGPVAVARVNENGQVASRPLPFHEGQFLDALSTGPDGLYAGTAVIKRWENVPDHLLRIDPDTLAIRARASFPSRVATVEQAGRMWATIGDGRVLRLDPRTLAVVASQRLFPADAVTLSGGRFLSAPAVGRGSLWVLAGNEFRLELVRMDSRTLAVRSRTRVPTKGRLAQTLNRVVADRDHVYVVGTAIARVGIGGHLHRPALPPDLATAEIAGRGLAGLTYRPAIVRLDARGRIVARTLVKDDGAQLVVSGHDAWFLGNAGHGNGIVHVTMR
jgi:hypothetical protein